jgi:preprotein translocase subunit SecD
MKRFISCFVFSILFAVTTFADSVKTVEVRPLAQSALISLEDFSSAKVSGVKEKAVLSIQLKETAAKRLEAYSSQHVGEELPLVVDGKVVGTPVIRAAIQGNVFQVEPLNHQVAENIAQLINSQH